MSPVRSQERNGPLGDEPDEVGALEQERREQEALDAELDAPRDAAAGEEARAP